METSKKATLDLVARIVAALGRPVLLSDLVADLRARGWRIPGHRVDHEDLVLDAGLHVAQRTFAAGSAVYVASTPFFSVEDGRGKVHAVVSYTRDHGNYRNDLAKGLDQLGAARDEYMAELDAVDALNRSRS